jgi:anti-sigma B factor antagonist
VAVVLAGSPPGVYVFALSGESDAYDADRLREQLVARADPSLPVIVDLGEATFVDSAVVALLIEAAREAERLGRRFLIFLPATAGTHVHRLFEITGLDTILPIFRSWDAAVATARRPDWRLARSSGCSSA